MENFVLGAYWWDRKESVEQCARRVVCCLRDIGQCDPALSRWFRGGCSRKEALERQVQITHETVRELLLRGRNRPDIGGEVMEELGFSMRLWNGGEDCQDVGFSVTCGGYAANPNIWNSCVVELPSEGPPFERILKVGPLLCLMRAIVTAFDPDWATVMPDSLRQIAQFGSNKPAVGWLFYAADRVWSPDRIPLAVRVVKVAEHSNIAVITEEQFNPQKPEHLQARDAVQAAITSTLPAWPP